MPCRPPFSRKPLLALGLLLSAALGRWGLGCYSGCQEISPTAEFRLVRQAPQEPVPESTIDTQKARESAISFTDITAATGIGFTHFSGMTEAKHYPTANGSGVALLDYDRDGRLDIYFATCTLLPLGSARNEPNRLYRNLGNNRYQDVTEQSGLGFRGFTHGIVVGDMDNDGDPDVFLCNYGPNQLFLNNGDGTFRNISHEAGIDRPGWSSGGAFLDFDNDGDLDLYVTNYGKWELPQDDRFCTDGFFHYLRGEKKIRVYCSPSTIQPVRHFLYRNNGNGTFTDVALAAGVGRSDGRGFGVVAADLNDDGLIDLYVANDMCPNFLYINRGDGTFEDMTTTSGAGFDADGATHSGMGADADDVNGDGLPDLVVTNFRLEGVSLYRNMGGGFFEDRRAKSGMLKASSHWVAWGCALADFDNDGWPDFFVSNGHVDDNLDLVGRDESYAQPPILFRNIDGKAFFDVSDAAGPYFTAGHVGRGAAFGDLDNDGDIDIVVNHKDGRPAVLRNDVPRKNHWIRVCLVGRASNRDAIGAKVEIKASGMKIVRQRKGGASLESSHDPRMLIGLGSADTVESLTVHWPSGRVSQRSHIEADKGYELAEPSGPNSRADTAPEKTGNRLSQVESPSAH